MLDCSWSHVTPILILIISLLPTEIATKYVKAQDKAAFALILEMIKSVLLSFSSFLALKIYLVHDSYYFVSDASGGESSNL